MSNAEKIEKLPEWGRWGDSRQLAVVCKTCHCTYTGRHWSAFAGKDNKGGMIGGVPKGGCSACKRRADEAARKALPIDPNLVAGVRAWAEANYEKDGWDYIVETYEDDELWEVIAGSKSLKDAIARAGEVASLLDDRRSDVRGY